MPRLLLVDDNPSIHRIAESLLAPTDIELVCVSSAAEALDRIGRGEVFDVALVDTAMPGMDGWTLLARLRDLEATARMPIALMSGVLDPVDPAKLAKAPVQGFLKKPIELRELGERVKALLATPVPVAPSPSTTLPATPAVEFPWQAEGPEVEPEAVTETLPPFEADPEPSDLSEYPEDLLLLTAEDLWPEETAVPPPAAPEVQLELEELDLESLQDLVVDAQQETPEPLEIDREEAVLVPAPAEAPTGEVTLAALADMEPLDTFAGDFLLSPVPAPEPAEAPVLPVVGEFAETPVLSVVSELVEAPVLPVVSEPAEAVAVLSVGPGAPLPDQTHALLQALLADPILVDILVRAVVARLGDQVIREIAWEVMPELAGRLQRPGA